MRPAAQCLSAGHETRLSASSRRAMGLPPSPLLNAKGTQDTSPKDLGDPRSTYSLVTVRSLGAACSAAAAVLSLCCMAVCRMAVECLGPLERGGRPSDISLVVFSG